MAWFFGKSKEKELEELDKQLEAEVKKEMEKEAAKENGKAPQKAAELYETSNGYMLQQDKDGEFILKDSRDELELSYDLCVIEFDEYFEDLLTMGPQGGMTLQKDGQGRFICTTKREQLAADFAEGRLDRDGYMNALKAWEDEIMNLKKARHQGTITEEDYAAARKVLGRP